ncbi:hypothetical protein NAI87_00365 [Clavibacter michiganensis subsp. michiganensis]|uniref:hypothetical protein n=1 Tax=Clavibacter michiganensis TaxID=28447 RepID=UPI00345B5535
MIPTRWVLPVDVLPDAADGWMLAATLAAAVATAASAVVVGIQAVQTRKSTEAAVRAAEASERNADAAVAAARVSERMFAESERARREAALPKITIHCPDFSEAGVYRLKPRDEDGWELLPEDFRLPLGDIDMFDEVAVRVRLTFMNDGDRSTVLTAMGPPFILDMSETYPESTLVVPAHGQLVGYVMLSQQATQWAYYDPYRDENDPASSALFTCEVGADRSASQNWQLTARGQPFRRDPDHDDVLIAHVTGTKLRCDLEHKGSELSEPVEEITSENSSDDT